jgi:hypothetical protein
MVEYEVIWPLYIAANNSIRVDKSKRMIKCIYLSYNP